MSSNAPVYPHSGVLIDPEGSPQVVGIRWAVMPDKKTLTVKWAEGKTESFPVSSITQDPATDRIVFVSNGVRYTIRELRPSDGAWLSALHTSLPLDVLDSLITQGDNPMSESLTAYALDNSPYIVGLVYTNELGSWVRNDGDWTQLSPNDTTFNGGDNMYGIDINLDQANDLVQMYDNNYVSVDDAEQYESADSGPSDNSDSDPDDDEDTDVSGLPTLDGYAETDDDVQDDSGQSDQ